MTAIGTTVRRTTPASSRATDRRTASQSTARGQENQQEPDNGREETDSHKTGLNSNPKRQRNGSNPQEPSAEPTRRRSTGGGGSRQSPRLRGDDRPLAP